MVEEKAPPPRKTLGDYVITKGLHTFLALQYLLLT